MEHTFAARIRHLQRVRNGETSAADAASRPERAPISTTVPRAGTPRSLELS